MPIARRYFPTIVLVSISLLRGAEPTPRIGDDHQPRHSGGLAQPATVEPAAYRGWSTQCLRNGMVELHVVPEIGGRVVQLCMGSKEFFWVNPQLAGTVSPPSGLGADGEWLNYGGDKLWPAPQGWDHDQQWPGPPDAVLDGQPYTLEVLDSESGQAGVRLTSREDPRSGIQFSRVIRLFPGSTRVEVTATMKNIDTRPRRWGIWSHTQLDAAEPNGSGPNRRMRAWCPINPQSRFPSGYNIIFGARDNPSFRADVERNLLEVRYRYQVGKIGVDSPAGWTATVDGTCGAVFVQRFRFEPNRQYPDDASVEFWHNGVGKIHAYNREMEFVDDPKQNPYIFESELLSPFCALQPGESCSWCYQWNVTNIGGDYSVHDCTDAGVVCEPLAATILHDAEPTRVRLTGRFGVFASGTPRVRVLDSHGTQLTCVDIDENVTPQRAFVLDTVIEVPREATAVALAVISDDGEPALLQLLSLRPRD